MPEDQADELVKEHAVALAEWVMRNVKDAPHTVKEYAEIIKAAWKS